ncbi:MAG: phytanoyl-CoA dioxygenase family protein [Moorea sp. SIO2B7]|nr:phytanoyl-CoA dioxygenase family protein [Moorena sp. SIO2B7]
MFQSKNWLVPWHQDKTIITERKSTLEGWGPWSKKDGVHHVQPPLKILNKIITFRIHLDPSSIDNGCLKVLPNTHNSILSTNEINKLVHSINAVACAVNTGDILVMKPLILHSYSKALSPANRRVIHLEYGNFSLPQELQINSAYSN